jgi:hypothetical protein
MGDVRMEKASSRRELTVQPFKDVFLDLAVAWRACVGCGIFLIGRGLANIEIFPKLEA